MKQTIAVENVKRCNVSNREHKSLAFQERNCIKSVFGHRATDCFGRLTEPLFLLIALVGVTAVKKDESSSKDDAQI